jgi:hypothetical protein
MPRHQAVTQRRGAARLKKKSQELLLKICHFYSFAFREIAMLRIAR